jgi:hypothetical protein
MSDVPTPTPVDATQDAAPATGDETFTDLDDDALDDLDDIEFVLEEIENRIAPLA